MPHQTVSPQTYACLLSAADELKHRMASIKGSESLSDRGGNMRGYAMKAMLTAILSMENGLEDAAVTELEKALLNMKKLAKHEATYGAGTR